MKTSSKTLLLVEDEVITGMAEAKTLESEGYNVIHVLTGEEAIDLFRTGKHKIDLILMDIDLGKGIDGTDAAQEILKSSDIPVVFLSCHTEKDIVEKTEKITSYGYVVKHSGITVLTASIKMAFKLHEANKRIYKKNIEIEETNEELKLTVEELEETIKELTQSEQKILEREKALKESERRYRLLADNSADCIWTMDMNMRFTYVSPSIMRLRGYSPEEAILQSISQVLTPDSYDTAMNVLDEELALEKQPGMDPNRTRTLELEEYHKDGHTLWVENSFSFIRDERGNPLYILGVMRDITERKQSNEALKESEERFRNLAESTPMAILIYQDNKWIYANSAAERITGYTRQELTLMDFWDMVHSDFKKIVEERGKKRQAGQQAVSSYEFKIITKSGEERWVLLNGTTSLFGGKPAGLINVIDITEIKEIQEELNRRNIQLNQKNMELQTMMEELK